MTYFANKLQEREQINVNIPFNVVEEASGDCECEDEQKKSGIHHHIYPELAIPRCGKILIKMFKTCTINAIKSKI